jgi:hypothetical protein
VRSVVIALGALAALAALAQADARLRVETTEPAQVTVDGIERGHAPLELVLPAGTHRVVATGEAYLPAESHVELREGEVTVVKLAMARAPRPLDLRVSPSFLAAIPLRGDTPFGTFTPGVALQVFHDVLSPVPSVGIGFDVEVHARALNRIGVGAVIAWCPARLASGTFAWCPATGVVTWMSGDREQRFDSGHLAARGLTALEARRRAGFARLGLGVSVMDYRRVADDRVLVLASGIVELSLGVDL